MRFFEATIEANKEIDRVIKKRESKFFEYHDVGYGGDVSLGADLAAEKIFFEKLSDFGYFYSEESGIVGEGENKIVLDPIDGSKNFVTNFPYYGTSVALVGSDGKTKEAVICNLANGDVFVKTKSFFKKGKLYDGELSDINEDHSSEIGLIERAYTSPKIAQAVADSCIKFRSPGAMALSLAYAKNCRFLLFLGYAREFDIAAGLFMVEDLNVKIDDRYILVSRSKQEFERISNIVKANL
ncbi:MAG: inositol monophosphatase family protein [Campylobacterales bacterium]